MSANRGVREHLPALFVSVGVGVVLVAAGFAIRVQQDRTVEAAVAATQTASVTDTPTPTNTLTPTPSNTPTITMTPTITPTGTLPPTFTPSPTLTPSPSPVPARPVSIDTDSYPTPQSELSTAIPPPADPVDIPSGVVNVLLLGSDKRPDDPGYRTDTIIIVTVNTEENTVNMLSIPRDLYVYVPGWTMSRINTAFSRGEAVGWEGGGAGLLKETLLYNFGIRVDYYAFVDLTGFKEIVDALDGIDVPVDCAIEGWTLKEPRYGPADFASYDEYVAYTADEANWEMSALPVGVHHLDGYMALWYARYRQGYTDFDRAVRQQQVLRAILTRAKSLGLLNVTHLPGLWQEYSDLVQTDMGLGNIFEFAPVAANLDSIEIGSYVLTPNELVNWFDPLQGQDVFLPMPGVVEEKIAQAMQPSSQNYILSNTATVEIRNGTTLDRLDEVAADRVLWNGLDATPTGFADSTNYEKTVIYDFTGSVRGNQLLKLQSILRVNNDQVIVQPDPNRVFDYVVIIGEDYRSCTRNTPSTNGGAATSGAETEETPTPETPFATPEG